MTPYEALVAAEKRAGSQVALAAICEVSQPAVWKWLKQTKRMPAEYVLKAEAGTGVSRHDLRPDIYPRPVPPKKARRASSEGLSSWDTGDYGKVSEFSDISPVERFA